MRRRFILLFAIAGLVLAGSQIILAQEQQEQRPMPAPAQKMKPMPAESNGPPPVLYIESERVQPGKIREHTKVVTDVIHIYDREKWPLDALGMSGITAPEGEAIFLVAFDSFGAIDKLEEQIGKSSKAALEEIERLESQESALHASKRTMLAVYRPDLSYRPDVNSVAKATYMYTDQRLVRFGHIKEYESDERFVQEAFDKANVNLHWFTYYVVSGAPNGTYIRLAPMASLAEWDAYGAKLKAMTDGLDDAGKERFFQLFKDSTVQAAGDAETPLTRLYVLRPDMSRVSDRFAAQNPDFWRPKRPPAEKPAEKPAAKPQAK